MLVDALADRWGSEVDATGTTAWFVLELGRAGQAPARLTGSTGPLVTGRDTPPEMTIFGRPAGR